MIGSPSLRRRHRSSISADAALVDNAAGAGPSNATEQPNAEPTSLPAVGRTMRNGDLQAALLERLVSEGYTVRDTSPDHVMLTRRADGVVVVRSGAVWGIDADLMSIDLSSVALAMFDAVLGVGYSLSEVGPMRIAFGSHDGESATMVLTTDPTTATHRISVRLRRSARPESGDGYGDRHAAQVRTAPAAVTFRSSDEAEATPRDGVPVGV